MADRSVNSNNWFYLLLGDYKRLANFLIMIGVLLLFMFGFSALFFKLLIANEVKITQRPEGAWVFSLGKKDKTIHYELNPSSMWANTGYKINKGQILKINASGRINLAGHRLMDAAKADSLPMFPWSGPEGIVNEKIINDPIIAKRRDCLLLPDAPIGALIAGISDRSFSYNSEMWEIGTDWEGISPETGYLWFAVNDSRLNENARSCYYADQNRALNWEYIIKNKYWNLWFDDNIGSLQINIEID